MATLNWICPSAEELREKRITIRSDGLQPVYNVLITDEQGNGIGNIKRVVLVLDVDANGRQLVRARIGLWQPDAKTDGRIEEVEITPAGLDLHAIALPEEAMPNEMPDDRWPDHRSVLERLARETEEDNE